MLSFVSRNETSTAASEIFDTNTNSSRVHIVIMSWMGRIMTDPFVKKWFGWLMTPVVIAFLLPLAILIFIWSSSLILYIHRVHKRRLMRRLREAVNERDIVKAGREVVAALWDAQVILCFKKSLISKLFRTHPNSQNCEKFSKI